MANHGELNITLGVEEEAFLIDPETRDLISDPDPQIFDECERNSEPHNVVRELLRSQIETNTRVCHSIKEVREAILETRSTSLYNGKKIRLRHRGDFNSSIR